MAINIISSMNNNNTYEYLLKLCVFVMMCVFNCATLITAAIQEENTLTIDVTADSLTRNSQKWSTYTQNNIRCYCNLPVCVSTSYMCKSEKGCFSEVMDTEYDQPTAFRQHDAYKGRHGCLELLGSNKDQRSECQNMPSSRNSNNKEHPKSLLLCCFKDLCNHIDSPETQNILNGTRFSATLSDSPTNSYHHPSMSSSSQHELNMSATPGYNSNEVWFKAAIIAVPICGIVILLLLITLAVKILRTDSLSASSKLGGPYSHAMDRKSNRDHFDQVHHQSSISLKKVPLLLHHDLMSGNTNHNCDDHLKHTVVPLLVQNEMPHHNDKKNETNAKLNEYNFVQQSKDIDNNSPLLGLHKNINTTSSCSNNVYRNVNLSLAPNPVSMQQVATDKLYDKQVLNAVINWGVPSPSSSPV